MQTATISWILSALSYDENKIVDYVTTLFPGFKCDFQGTDDGAHFFGAVIDPDLGRAWGVNRGTDGYDKKGNLKSWLIDMNILKGDDGVHNGFQMLGNRAFNEMKHYFGDADELIFTGHSQGAGVSPYMACLAVECLTWVPTVHFDLFAAPPTGNDVFAARVQRHMNDGNLTGDNYINKRDPVSSKHLRNEKSFFLDGVDVGTEIVLPEIIGYNMGPFDAVQHSCRVYNAMMILNYATMGYSHIDDYLLLGKIHSLIVN